MPVTMKDIAARSGTSRTAVSLILNQKGERYSKETRERVLLAAKTLGYRINSAALAVSSGRFDSVAFLQDFLIERSVLPEQLLTAVHHRLAECEKGLSFVMYPDDGLKPGFAPLILKRSCADGLLINYHAEMPDSLRALISDRKVPCVWINNLLPANCVYPDEERAARRATEYLVQLGHRRISYLDPTWSLPQQHPHYSRDARYRGYVSAMAAAHLKPQIMTAQSADELTDRVDWFRSILKVEPRPSAMVVNWSPIELVHVAEQMGLNIPQDLAVISFYEPGRLPDREHPTILNDWQAVGRAAVDMLEKRMRSSKEQKPVRVPAQFLHLERLPPWHGE